MKVARAFLVLVAALTFSASAAQPAESRHAWVVVDDAEAGAILVHIPPRVPTASASPAPDRRVARVARLSRSPEWLVPVGDTVYCIMHADEQGVHRVGRSRAFPRGLRDLWGADPGRRLEVLPAITGLVHAVTDDGTSPLALVTTDDGTRVHRLETDRWSAISPPIPDQFALDEFDAAGLVWRTVRPTSSPLELGDPDSGDPDSGEQVTPPQSPDVVLLRDGAATRLSLIEGAWQREPGVPSLGPGDAESLRVVGDWRGELILLAQDEPDRARVLALGDRGFTELGPVGVSVRAEAAILGIPGRLVFLEETELDGSADLSEEPGVESETPLPAPVADAQPPRLAIIEFSLVSGRTLASGLATTSSPVSRSEFQSLALLLFACMVVLLVVVVRPTPQAAEPVLPPGTAIAPASRRLMASVFDLAPALLVASEISGLSVAETLGPIALPLTGSVDIMPLLLTLAIAAGHCAVGEMLTGRSIGKLLTGTFVARVDPEPGATPTPGRFRPPTPGGAILRNVLKWFLFPATAIVLSDPEGRHRGDLLARVAVLMPVPAVDDPGT